MEMNNQVSPLVTKNQERNSCLYHSVEFLLKNSINILELGRMLFPFFIHLGFSVHQLYASKTDRYLLTFEPLDIIQVLVPSFVVTSFGGWSNADGLLMEIETATSKGKMIHYGPFQHKDGVLGIYVSSEYYLVRLTNESPHTVSIALKFSDYIPSGESIYPGYLTLETSETDPRTLLDPIIYGNSNSKHENLAVFLIFIFPASFIFCCVLCCCYCCCCD